MKRRFINPVAPPRGVGVPGARMPRQRMLGDYPIPPGATQWDIARIKALATQNWKAETGVDQSQGSAYGHDPAIERALQIPQDPGVNLLGWVNPFTLVFYTFSLLTTNALTVIPGNKRRAYLLIQNQGPGNIYVNFGQDATAATASAPANCLQLIQTQVYELIGGGDVDGHNIPRAACFVPGNYVSIIADAANTTALIGEGTWHFRES